MTSPTPGPASPPHDLPRIWERLYRGDQSRAERGLGLGLSLVKAIVPAHGGTVDVTTQPGVGSTFTIVRLRLAKATARQVPPSLTLQRLPKASITPM